MKKLPIYRFFFQFSVKIREILTKIGSGLKSAISPDENFRFKTSWSSNMILSPFALSSGLSVKIIISELKGGREKILLEGETRHQIAATSVTTQAVQYHSHPPLFIVTNHELLFGP